MSLLKGDRACNSRMKLIREKLLNSKTRKFYIFGYGSLMWKPNFNYSRSWIGYIEGYERRFYQGTTTNRGTQEWPGRVATLVPSPDPKARVWGITFEVEGAANINAATAYLTERELIMGGYRCVKVTFVARKLCTMSFEPSASESMTQEIETALIQFDAHTYIAEPENCQYVGEASLEVQAMQIAKAVGFCGANVDYLIHLVEFINTEVPREDLHFDQYVLDLHALVIQFIPTPFFLPHRIQLDSAKCLAGLEVENQENAASSKLVCEPLTYSSPFTNCRRASLYRHI